MNLIKIKDLNLELGISFNLELGALFNFAISPFRDFAISPYAPACASTGDATRDSIRAFHR